MGCLLARENKKCKSAVLVNESVGWLEMPRTVMIPDVVWWFSEASGPNVATSDFWGDFDLLRGQWWGLRLNILIWV